MTQNPDNMVFNNRIAVVTGENICIDGGMTRQMIYHGDNGWWLKKVDEQ